MKNTAYPNKYIYDFELTDDLQFHNSFINFDKGIRVGHLEPQQRVTQILKHELKVRHGVDMICDRWGRGVYWQWICWVPKPNRSAKPISSSYNFSSSKFFISVDKEDRVFQAGMQIERAPKSPAGDDWGIALKKDWDWHVLQKALKGNELPRILQRLLREGFLVRAGAFSSLLEFDRRSWDLKACQNRVARFSGKEWGGFQLFWPMTEKEVLGISGPDVIRAVLAVFDELAPAMNLCMYAPCLRV